MTTYDEFLARKRQLAGDAGFEPLFMPDFLFPFQRALVEWSVRRGRAACLEDCGLGKTIQQLVWSQNVYQHTGKPVLLLTPLAVGPQTALEANRFGIDAAVSRDGTLPAPITITNYQQLHKFNERHFGGVALDESSILKNFDGATKQEITIFMRKMKYRSLWSATAAPNDFIELGTSSEALGYLGFMDMLSRFFKKTSGNDRRTQSRKDEFRDGVWRFRGHSETEFWRWVCSWARAVKMPSDLGFSNEGFELPPLEYREHVVQARTRRPDMLIDLPAIGLAEQRQERRRTLTERCELAASLVANTGEPAVVWCHLNPEGKLLTKLIPGAVEVCGDDSDEQKEEAFTGFSSGKIRVLVTKDSLACFGLNWQHCAHQVTFASHSFERLYQSVRRCWRFGQKRPVTIDIVTSEGERGVLKNVQRKAAQSEVMFARLVELVNSALHIDRPVTQPTKQEMPTWI